MIQRAKINIQPDDCIIIVHYDELCELGFELRHVLDHSFAMDISKLHELERLLHAHYIALEERDSNV